MSPAIAAIELNLYFLNQRKFHKIHVTIILYKSFYPYFVFPLVFYVPLISPGFCKYFRTRSALVNIQTHQSRRVYVLEAKLLRKTKHKDSRHYATKGPIRLYALKVQNFEMIGFINSIQGSGFW